VACSVACEITIRRAHQFGDLAGTSKNLRASDPQQKEKMKTEDKAAEALNENQIRVAYRVRPAMPGRSLLHGLFSA